MDKFEATAAMKEGKKVRHRFFSSDEWVTIKDGKYVFEDGVVCSPEEFWRYRNLPQWNDDWEIVN